jgi:MFS family permease
MAVVGLFPNNTHSYFLSTIFLDFHNPSSSQLGLLNAIQQVGGICALAFAFQLTDRLGRRWAIMVSHFIHRRSKRHVLLSILIIPFFLFDNL